MAASTARIFGKEIFFNFIEFDYADVSNNTHRVEEIKKGDLHGFVAKGVFSKDEIEQLKVAIAEVPDEEKMNVPTGKFFPRPFATVTDSEEKLDAYINKGNDLLALQEKPIIKTLLSRLDEFFNNVSKPMSVKVPAIRNRDAKTVPGTFRYYLPDRGGLFVHCGYLFQNQSPYYYQVIEPMAMEGQLSFFMVLQNSEVGGELTIYDMLWKDVKRKDSPDENEYVIDDAGNKLYLKDVPSFFVKPEPGDILVFSGGPIWHRVENISGAIPRMTFGGFINFSNNGDAIYYWS